MLIAAQAESPAPFNTNGEPLPRLAPLLNLRQVAELLNCGTATVERRHAAGLLPAPRKFGRLIRWSGPELLEWLARPKPNGELLNREEWSLAWAELVRSGRN